MNHLTCNLSNLSKYQRIAAKNPDTKVIHDGSRWHLIKEGDFKVEKFPSFIEKIIHLIKYRFSKEYAETYKKAKQSFTASVGYYRDLTSKENYNIEFLKNLFASIANSTETKDLQTIQNQIEQCKFDYAFLRGKIGKASEAGLQQFNELIDQEKERLKELDNKLKEFREASLTEEQNAEFSKIEEEIKTHLLSSIVGDVTLTEDNYRSYCEAVTKVKIIKQSGLQNLQWKKSPQDFILADFETIIKEHIELLKTQ